MRKHPSHWRPCINICTQSYGKQMEFYYNMNYKFLGIKEAWKLYVDWFATGL